MTLFNNFYANKRVLVTGHAGFKGSWLTYILHQLNAQVAGYSLLPNTKERMYTILNLEEILTMNSINDIRNEDKLKQVFADFQPEIVIHMAAQALVRPSYHTPVETYSTNVIGTLCVLEATRASSSVKVFINVTSDKCYENKEDDYAYKESDTLGGYDIYSSSKACSEILTSSYRRSFLQSEKSFALASVRSGNVIGGGDWSSDRLIPDCVEAFYRNELVSIRNPLAVRPWQHVLEPLFAYLLLAYKIYKEPSLYSSEYNFGPEPESTLKVSQVAELVAQYWNKANSTKDQFCQAEVSIKEDNSLHEAGLLQLDIAKAKKELGFYPIWNAQTAIEKTVNWYSHFYNKDKDMLSYTKEQIEDFIIEAQNKNILWSL